jgi:hypothetical protein
VSLMVFFMGERFKKRTMGRILGCGPWNTNDFVFLSLYGFRIKKIK